jgi:fibronectin type III domain protein
MNTALTALISRRPWWLAALVLVPVLLLALQGMTFQARAAELQWVDGGDDQLCLQDDVGAALSHPEIEQCSPIIGCETGETGGRPWIRFPNHSGVWQPKDEFKGYDVYYATDPTSSPSPSATASASPTTSASATPTAKPTTKATTKPSTKPSSSASSSASPSAGVTSTAGTPADDLGIDADEEVADGAPTAPAAPTVEVDGSDVTVTWEATADAELEGVTGYVLRFSGADPVETDATTTSHTFKALPDGNYRAAVRAVNEAGTSPSSPPSDIATVGTPIEQVKGQLSVDGDLQPGATVTVSGTGYAVNVPELVLELHSTPVQLATVATDADGGFSTTVTVPADVEPGDHHLVVLYDGTEITSTPVALVAAGAADSAATIDKALDPTKSVPPRTGLVILGALAALGFAALAWHPVRSRRRRRHAYGAPQPTSAPSVPLTSSSVSGISTEVI